ncbi:hypothetical protein [Streptomyces sp. NBC_00503]|uniref:hypothetical protein n=1 Tax=Streptomyces sp. NBC_00503 TaxID=2903659 RepID=UPI002E80E427|nr:hypothetical protein [Streptomyces sp. NBC_00503]WUD83893.1 hypothetical protein OG490_26945 [Streptomyces sp. NBC_00503]
MGASSWGYVTSYEGGVQASLDALHARVFVEEFGETGDYADLAELWADGEFMGTGGTHTILDVPKAAADSGAAEEGALRPLSCDRLLHHFGTGRPTVARYEAALAAADRSMSHQEYEQSLLGEEFPRWSGLYVLLYGEAAAEGAEPTHVGFFGCSGD